jgi:hypothetical protein
MRCGLQSFSTPNTFLARVHRFFDYVLLPLLVRLLTRRCISTEHACTYTMRWR